MRRLVGPLALVLLVMLAITGTVLARGGLHHAPQKSVRASAAIPYTVYVLGANITNGQSATTSSHSYRALLLADLQAHYGSGYSVSLESTATYANGWKVGNAWTAIQAHPPTAGTNLVVIEVGTNDFTAGASLSAFTATYNQLVAYARAQAGPAAQIACMGIWRDTPSDGPWNDAIYQACVNNQGTQTIDDPQTGWSIFQELDSFYDISGDRASSGWPNNAGHRDLASGVECTLQLLGTCV